MIPAQSDAASPEAAGEMVVAVLSSDIWLKSRRTRRRLVAMVEANLREALGPEATVSAFPGHRLLLGPSGGDLSAAARVFGVASLERQIPVPFTDLEDLAAAVSAHFAPLVAGRTFAVRARRRGKHSWSSYDLACAAGDLLREAGGTVDLDAPEVTAEVRIRDGRAAVVAGAEPGPGGLPVGSQEGVLALLSGGIDSPVAAWMMMSRGCRVDYLHFMLDCAQGDHALSVGRALWDEWGAGHDAVAHVVDLRPAAEALVDQVAPKMRQVALKALMARAASVVAAEEGLPALVTGESLGQVSSQTLAHLVALSGEATVPTLRPLLGLDKNEIVRRATAIGTYELSARAREVCDLSAGMPVEVAASPGRVAATTDRVPDDLWRAAVAERQRFLLREWLPGMTTDGV